MAGSAIGAGLGLAFGNDPDYTENLPFYGKPLENIFSPAYDVDVNNSRGQISISLSKGLEKAVQQFQQLSEQRASEIGDLLPRVAPGLGGLTAARLGMLREARERAVGNASREFGRRGVLGSSFGQAGIADIERGFGTQAGLIGAESFLQELDLTNQLQAQRTRELQQGLATEMDVRTGASSSAMAAVSSLMNTLSENARFIGDNRIAEEIGKGELFGQIGAGISSLFTVNPYEISL